ncbi:MAG: hypothetical protein ACOYU3_00220 [Bacillota bacterium]
MAVLYVGLKASVKKTQLTDLYVGDVAHLFMEKESVAPFQNVQLGAVQPGWRAVLPVQVVQALTQVLPQGTNIQMIGEQKCMVQGIPAKRKKRPFAVLAVVVIAMLLFFGGALTLMNFHADVDMPRVHAMISTLITGDGNTSALWISIPYSIGIGLGVLFFTGIGKKRTNPNLFELEEQEYRDKVEKYLQKNEAGETKDG